MRHLLVFSSLFSASLLAQEISSQDLRNWNDRVLAASQDSRGKGRDAASQAIVGTAARQRADALAQLIRQDPEAALRSALPEEALQQLRSQVPAVDVPVLESWGTWSGRAEHIILDGEDESHQDWITISAGGKQVDVHFTGDTVPGIQCGDQLTVSGVRLGDSIAAGSSSVLVASSNASGGCSTQGEQKTAVLMVNFPTVKSSLSLEQVEVNFFQSTGRSLNTYWNETSYGKTTATGNVFGWFTLDRTYSCDEYYQMLEAAILAADPVIDFTAYSRLFVVFPQSGSCAWAGISTVGCAYRSSPGDGGFLASVAWLPTKYMTSNTTAVKLIAHEAGHGLGLYHARARTFEGEPVGTQTAAGTVLSYGDKLSSMGSWNLGHYAAPHKSILGWLSAGSSVRVVESSSVHTIQPIEVSPAGLQALKVRRGTDGNSWLWLESRRKLGDFDSSLSSSAFNGVLVHLDVSGPPYTDLLDFAPSTSSTLDASLNVGQTWVDPYSNLTLKVLSGDDNGVTVSADYGATSCTTAPPTMTLMPTKVTVARGATSYLFLTIQNRDTQNCPSSEFEISAPEPGGWTTTVPTPKVKLTPGGESTVFMTKTVPSSAASGSYPFQAVVKRGAETKTISGTIVVP